MILSAIKENKTDVGLAAGGAGLGMLLGNELYKHTPTRMVRYAIEGDKRVPYITNKFIDYAKKVSEKDCFNNIDPHTSRSWLNGKLETIRKNASMAKINPRGSQRWDFQKMYNLGIEYMTNRENIPKDSLHLGPAKRGANAIYYGRQVEKRNSIIAGALIGAAACLIIKKGIEKYKDFKESGKNVKDFLPFKNND